MIRISFVLLLASLFTSCAGLRVVTNGKPVRASDLPAATDSMIVINRFDSIKIDEHATLVGTTRIKAPSQSTSYYYRAMVGVCKKEAQRLHGNLIEVLDYSNFIYAMAFSSWITANIYSVPDKWMTDLKHQMDSVKEQKKKSLEGKVVVHLRFQGHFFGLIPGKFKLYFNHTLLYKFADYVSPNAPGEITTLTFTEPGYLSVGPEISAPDHMKVWVATGREYYIFVRIDRYREAHMTKMNRDYFLNDL